MQAFVRRFDGGLSVRNAQGVKVNGRLLRATPDAVVFEAYGPGAVARTGETLESVTLQRAGGRTFGGPARVTEVFSTGASQIVTAVPSADWLDGANDDDPRLAPLAHDVDALLRDWEADQRLTSELRIAVSSLQSFLTRLNHWAAPIDLAVEAANAEGIPDRSVNLAEGIFAVVGPQLRKLFGQFEDAAAVVPAEFADARRAFVQQELHPLLLCAPLLHRSVAKPLGYSGDYEMVNMILRNGMEGAGLYARLVNAHILRIDIAQGHRNRIAKLTDMLREEARRAAAQGRPLRVLNVGCGPAEEVVRFIGRDPSLSERCEFTLVDFNAETIRYAEARIAEATRASGRGGPNVTFVKRSVNDLLKEASRGVTATAAASYDLVYCAGLFDYLSDKVCARLLNFFHERSTPGGLVVATNVHPRHDARATMDDLADWRLILRTEEQMASLAPAAAVDVSSASEPSGSNVFLEFRRVAARISAAVDERERGTSRYDAPHRSIPGV